MYSQRTLKHFLLAGFFLPFVSRFGLVMLTIDFYYPGCMRPVFALGAVWSLVPFAFAVKPGISQA